METSTWRRGRYNNTPHIHAKFHAFLNGEGEKVSWKLWKISLSAKHCFYSFPPLEESAALQNGGQSGFCKSNKVRTSGLLSLCWLLGSFPFEQPNSLKNFGAQSVQLHTTPCHTGLEPGWGLYCFWHRQLLQGFLSANLWELDYVLEVILWCLLIEGLGALTVCLFSVGDGKYFLFSLAQTNFCFSLCIGSKRSGPERFRGPSAGTESGSGRMAIIFLILIFWSDVQNLGWWSQCKNLKTQEWSSVDF